MPENRSVSRRGVYYDLNQSPHVHTSACGDIFRFSSAKKLEIFERELPKELEKLDKIIARNALQDWIPPEFVFYFKRQITGALYKRIEGKYGK